jgi:hypothetical protein
MLPPSFLGADCLSPFLSGGPGPLSPPSPELTPFPSGPRQRPTLMSGTPLLDNLPSNGCCSHLAEDPVAVAPRPADLALPAQAAAHLRHRGLRGSDLHGGTYTAHCGDGPLNRGSCSQLRHLTGEESMAYSDYLHTFRYISFAAA